MASKTLILGYGNVDRQDDGVAWIILSIIAEDLNLTVSEIIDEHPDQADRDGPGNDPSRDLPDLFFSLQLTPEMAEMLATYDRVCFVDAHTGAVPEEIHFVALSEGFQPSPMTHHLTPQTCLALARTLYGNAPKGNLLSIRGYEFGFSNELSNKTQALTQQAATTLLDWLDLAK